MCWFRGDKLRMNDLQILPATKIADVLDTYPQLEDVLIGMAPPFRKLKNPFLRKGIAKIASLEQAATVGRMAVNDLVNRLRAAVGQEALALEDAEQRDSYFTPQPAWFDRSKIVASINEPSTGPYTMPIVAVLQVIAQMEPAQILELITTFVPAPGIAVMRSKGLLVWSVQESPELIRTYVAKPAISSCC